MPIFNNAASSIAAQKEAEGGEPSRRVKPYVIEINDLCEMLNVGKNTAYHLIVSGEIDAVISFVKDVVHEKPVHGQGLSRAVPRDASQIEGFHGGEVQIARYYLIPVERPAGVVIGIRVRRTDIHQLFAEDWIGIPSCERGAPVREFIVLYQSREERVI